MIQGAPRRMGESLGFNLCQGVTQPRELQERILHFALPRSRQPALAHLREQPGQQTWGLTPASR
jgi:hypothetical protein